MAGRQSQGLLLATGNQRNVPARIAGTALVFLLLPKLVLFSGNVFAEASCSPEPGAAGCGEESSDLGSANQNRDSYHVGNPIDLVTGNKYQRGDDFAAFASPLGYTRHYNTALADQDIGLGFGWRDTYSLRLYAVEDKGYRLVQSDGRSMLFNALADDGITWMADTSHDGVLAPSSDGSLQWTLPDERVWSFVGSYPVSLQLPDGTGLSLTYRNQRLHSVTDDLGASLHYFYTEGRRDLVRYSVDHNGTQPGHLACLQLPDGTGVRYAYDRNANLVSVIHTDGVDWQYQYSDERFPSHISYAALSTADRDEFWGCEDEFANDAKNRMNSEPAIAYESRWEYNPDGRANVWQHGDRRVSVDYDVNVNEDGAASQVHRYSSIVRDTANPRTYRYDFTSTGDGTAHVHEGAGVYVKNCEDCDWDRLVLMESRALAKPVVEDNPTDQNQNLAAFPYLQRRQLRDELIQMGVGVNEHRFGGAVYVVPESLLDVEAGWQDSGESGQNAEAFSALRTLESTNPIRMRSSNVVTSPNGPPHGATTPAPATRPFCPLPAGMTCSQLEDAMIYAQLSSCAYDVSACPSDWQIINPVDLGLNPLLFEDGAYHAVILYHPGRDEFVVAFEGTSPLSIGDWSANTANYLNTGNPAQYATAIEAGEEISTVLGANHPNSGLTFTGHSLGGGLASAAALAAPSDAVVFNSAAVGTHVLHVNGVNLVGHENLIDVINVENDIVTNFQENVDPQINDPNISPNSFWPAPGTHYTIGVNSNYNPVQAHLMNTVHAELDYIHDDNCP